MPRLLPKDPRWDEVELPLDSPGIEGFECTVLGTLPRPQGSMRHVGGGRLVYGDELIQWRRLLKLEFEEAKPAGWVPIDDACHLDLCFAFPQPKATPKWRRECPLKGTGSDLDKLCRAVGDALEQAGIIENDSRVASLTAVKGFAPLVLTDVGVAVKVSQHELPTR